MIQVKRLGHATFKTPDLERIVDYWTRIIGLTLVDKDKNRAFLATKYGEEAIAVEAGEGANLVKAAFQVAPGSELADLQKDLAEEGIKSELQSDISPGVSRAIVFADPKGTIVEIYSDYRHRRPRHRRAGRDAAQVRAPGLSLQGSGEGDELLHRRPRL